MRDAALKQAKVKLAPETPVGDTDLPLSETSGQHADTCKQIMAEKPAPVVTSAFGRGLRMDIVVHVEPKLNLLPWEDQCGDATVDVVISGTHSFWRDHRKLQQHETRLALGWDEESDPNETTRSVITIPDLLKPLATLNSDSQAPLHPSFDTYTSLNQEQQLDLQRSERAWITSVEWGSEIGKKPIHFRFQTNWVEKRGVGSCYVVLPSLSANNFLPGQEAAACALAQRQGEEPLDCTSEEVVYDYLSHADPPTHGRVVLSMEDNNLEESTPEPNDYEAIWRPGPEHENPDVNLITASRAGEEHAAPVWTCLPTQDLSFLRGEHSSIPPAGSFAGNACGAIAVVEPPAAEEVRTTIILIGTVLAAIFAEQFFEALFRRYRRRREGAT